MRCRCDLQPFSEAGFDRCLAGGRRLIMIGDSTMNGIFNSLACLLRSRLATGHLEPWERSEVTDIRGDYTSRSGDIYLQVRCSLALPCPIPLPTSLPEMLAGSLLHALAAGSMREGTSLWRVGPTERLRG